MSGAISFFGWTGTLTAIYMSYSPWSTFRAIEKAGTVGEASPIPYIVYFINSFAWAAYGVETENWNVFLCNIAALTFTFRYFMVFYAHSQLKDRKKFEIFTLVLLVLIYVLFMMAGMSKNPMLSLEKALGTFASGCSISVYVAPLLNLRTAFKLKSIDVIPFLPSIAFFSNGSIWFIYGLLMSDVFILLPNVLGVVIAVLQMMGYVYIAGPAQSIAKLKSTLSQSGKKQSHGKNSEEIHVPHQQLHDVEGSMDNEAREGSMSSANSSDALVPDSRL